MSDLDESWPLACHRCGAILGHDADDRADGGPDGLPICGPCARSRDEEADLSWMDARDGELDGTIEW
jgi:hypothetical protein